MNTLTDLIHTFQRGGLSRDDLFAQIDRAVAMDPRGPARLFEILNEEHTRTPLPPDVHAELVERIRHITNAENDANGEQTRLLTGVTNLSQTYPTGTERGAPHGSATSPGDDSAAQIKGVGDTLNGRFVLEECLGIGGMGTVYKALDLRKLEASDRNPYIAIKVLNVQFRGHPKSLIALQREARKAQTLAHRNIVTVYDFDRDGPMVYLTMEYLSGRSLSSVLRDPNFAGMSFAKALPIITGMGNALAYAHERGFVHCDFKPANVFLTNSGEVKVIDFGIARIFQRPDTDAEPTVFDPSSLGAMTPAYASPEMFEHLEPDPRDDIYALACVTYELLTGRHPYGRMSAAQARAAGIKPKRPDHLGLRQWRALKHALAFDRDARTPAVNRFLDELGSGRSSPMPMWLAGGGALALALIAGGWAYYHFREAPPEEQAQQATAPTQPTTTTTAPAAGTVAPPAATAPATAPSTATAPAKAPQASEEGTASAQPLSLASVTPVIARLPCSALTASVDGNTVLVHGLLGEGIGEATLRRQLGLVAGVKSVKLDVQPAADDKCATLKLLSRFWTLNQDAGRPAAIRTRAPKAQLTEGDPLVLDISTPPYDTYVYVDYFSLDGNVAHLLPNQRAKRNQAPPSYAATIGSLGEWVISKPFGNELVVLITTPTPLFPALRPEVENRATYLQALDKQLADMASGAGRDRIKVDLVQITSQPKAP